MALIITMFVCGVQTTGTHYQDTVCVSWQVTIFACKPLKSRQQFIRTLYLGVLISDNSHMICSWLIYDKWFHLQPWQLHTHVIFITTVIGKQSGFKASLLPTTCPTQGMVWLVPTSLNLSTCGCNGIPSKTTTYTHTHSDYVYPKIPVNTLVCLDTGRLAAHLNRVLAPFGIPFMQSAVWSLRMNWDNVSSQNHTENVLTQPLRCACMCKICFAESFTKNVVCATIALICSIYIRS